MTRPKITNDDLKAMRNTVVVLHGCFERSFFDVLASREPQSVYVMEGRPSLDAAKSSSKELLARGIKPTIIADNMAGFLFYKQLVKEVYLACIDVSFRGALCHIGASILSCLAKKHGIPIYLYPSSVSSKRKQVLMDEESSIMSLGEQRVAPKGTKGYVPLMEWVPGKNCDEDNVTIIDQYEHPEKYEKPKHANKFKKFKRVEKHDQRDWDSPVG